MEATVREQLAASYAARKAKLDTGRVDTVFKVRDQVLLQTRSCLTPRISASFCHGGTAHSR